MAFSSIPLPSYQSPQDRSMNSLLKSLNISSAVTEAIEKAKQQEFQNKLLQSEEDRTNQLFPEQLKKAQMENQLYIPKTEADINYKNANTNRLNFQQQNPLYGQAGAAGQIGAAELLRKNPQLVNDPNAINTIMNALNTNISSKNSLAELNSKRSSGYEFNSLPAQNKSYLLAQAAGMGIEPNEAVQRFNKGETVDQMALSQGFSPQNKPDPVYPLTTSGQTQLKNRQAALIEMNRMGKKIGEWSGPYVSKIFGLSPIQVKDALLGLNKDKQSKFLAARMLAPEQAAIRLRSMGGNVGIEAIREMTDKSLLNGKIFESLVDPDVYQKANDLVEETIEDSVNAANSAVSKGVNSKSSGRLKYNSSTGMLE